MYTCSATRLARHVGRMSTTTGPRVERTGVQLLASHSTQRGSSTTSLPTLHQHLGSEVNCRTVDGDGRVPAENVECVVPSEHAEAPCVPDSDLLPYDGSATDLPGGRAVDGGNGDAGRCVHH